MSVLIEGKLIGVMFGFISTKVNGIIWLQKFRYETGDHIFVKAQEYKPFFFDLLFYYIAERYPDYKRQLSSNITETRAREVLNKTEEVFVWLQSLSRFKK